MRAAPPRVATASHIATFFPLVRPCSAAARGAPPFVHASSAGDRRRTRSAFAGFDGGGSDVAEARASAAGIAFVASGGLDGEGGESGGGSEPDFRGTGCVPGPNASVDDGLAKTRGDGSGMSLTGGALGRALGRGGLLGVGRGTTLAAIGEELGAGGPLTAAGPVLGAGGPLTTPPLF